MNINTSQTEENPLLEDPRRGVRRGEAFMVNQMNQINHVDHMDTSRDNQRPCKMRRGNGLTERDFRNELAFSNQ